jgi:hypothetical protein
VTEVQAPRASFWGFLTAEGRLKNEWAHALQDADPDRRVERMRRVLERLRGNPDNLRHLWLPFVETFLDSTSLASLSETDFAAVENMADSLAANDDDAISYQLWSRLLSARDARGERRQAIVLLTHIYRAPSATAEIRTQCARDLANRRATGDAQIDVYVEYLRAAASPARETDILELLEQLCRVDFAAEEHKLKRAAEVAKRLASLAKVRALVPGLHTAIGLCELLVANKPEEAIGHFESALRLNASDEEATVGLVAAGIRAGAYDVAERAMKSTPQQRAPVVKALLVLGNVLQWLDQALPGPPPATAETLASHSLERYVGDAVVQAIGRLQLIEGNARAAAATLAPLADRHPEEPRWGYYAAWAAALSGDDKAVRRRLSTLDTWTGRWTVAALLNDLAPGHHDSRRTSRTRRPTKEPTADYAIVNEARHKLARMETPPAFKWHPSGRGGIEQDLEALRTALGNAAYSSQAREVERLIAMPLFSRLPLPDRLVWQALHALLRGDRAHARVLLRDSATRLGYGRAALVLAVLELEDGNVAEGKWALERAAGTRMDAKIELLRAHLDALEGHPSEAAVRLERIAADSGPRAQYALGCAYLNLADTAKRENQNNRVTLFREQAAGALEAAAKSPADQPSDLVALAGCATMVAHPERGASNCAETWQLIERLSPARRRQWILWVGALAQIWTGSPSSAAAAAQALLEMVDEIGPPNSSAASAIVQALVRCATRAEAPEQADAVLKLAERLSALGDDASVRYFAGLVTTAAARIAWDRVTSNREAARRKLLPLIEANPANGTLRLLLASAHLAAAENAEAAAILRSTQTENQLEQRFSEALSAIIDGRAPDPADWPRVSTPAPAALVQACHLLAAAASFAAGTQEAGFDALLAAMRSEAIDSVKVVDVSASLPLLCAQAARERTVPTTVVELVRRLAQRPAAGATALTIARCATAAGELELARTVLEQAVADEAEADGPLHRELAPLLCYLAVAAWKAGAPDDAVAKLRVAAELSPAGA